MNRSAARHGPPVLAFAALLLLAGCHHAGPSDVLRPSNKFVLDLVGRYDAGRTKADSAAVAPLLAPGFQLITAQGASLGRDSLLVRVAAGGDQGTRSDVTVKLFDRVTLVESYWSGGGPAGSPPDDQRCTMVWVLRDPGWQVVLDQCTAVPRPAS